MQVRTYADILDRIEALAGKDSFVSAEQTRILSLVNARWFRAYRASEYWPRYIYVGEARYVDPDTGAIPFTQSSAVLVSGAGTGDVNGFYQPAGTLNTKTLYYLNGDTSSVAIFYTGSNWRIASDVSSTIVYYDDGGGGHPWLNSWTAVTGMAPVPTVAESSRADIDSFMRLTTAAPYGAEPATGYEVDFYVTNNGAIPASTPPDPYTQLFVTHKAEWGGPFAASTTEVPIEFFEYIAHGAFADWLRSSGQSIPQAQAENAVAQEMLNYELLKSQSRANAQVNNQRFSTYISNQSRSGFYR